MKPMEYMKMFDVAYLTGNTRSFREFAPAVDKAFADALGRPAQGHWYTRHEAEERTREGALHWVTVHIIREL